jgi:predicted kinase
MICLITGMMASGKSTVAELLAQKFELSVHLWGDVFRKMIASGRAEMSANPSAEAVSQLHLRYQLTAQTAKAYADNGFTVIVQDNYYGEMLPFVLSLLKPYKARVFVLCPTVETIRAREQSRAKSGYVNFGVESLYNDFMANTPRIGFWIDNSSESAEETAARIYEYCG